MAKIENQKNNNNSAATPFIIIGAVLVVVIAGVWWFSQSGSEMASNTSTANKSNISQADLNAQALAVYNSAPPGAQPANSKGSPSATVTVEEFADFQCPTCASVHGLMKQINALYGSRINFIFREFPLQQIHANAYTAALAAESAGRQGKFWAMQDQLFTNQQTWSNSQDARAIFEQYAKQIGLDVEKFREDMTALPTKQRIDADIQRARALGVSATPSIYVNGISIPSQQMTVDSMRRIIDAELQRASSQTQPAQMNSTDSENNSAAETNKTKNVSEATK